MNKLSVYQDFFTNGAVAWFSSGIVSMLFTRDPFETKILLISLSLSFTLVFIRIAIMVQDYEY